MIPTLDVNRVLLDAHFRTQVTLCRRAVAIDAHGRTAVTETTSTIGAVVRPANEKELERLPEGDRDHGHIKVLSESEMHAGTSTEQPDEIVWAGARWVVRICDPWMYGRSFWSAICEMKAIVPTPTPEPDPDPEPDPEPEPEPEEATP